MTDRQIAHMVDLSGTCRRFIIDDWEMLTRRTGAEKGWETRDYLTVNGQRLSVIAVGDKAWLVADLEFRKGRHAYHLFCREVPA